MNVCSIEGCEKPVKVKSLGWCSAHCARYYRLGDPLGSSKSDRGPRRPVYGTEQRCNVCKTLKPMSEYYVRDTDKGPWYYRWCKSCHTAKMKTYNLKKKAANPPKPKVKPDHGECAYEGCTSKAKLRLKDGPAGWYCTGHWTQWHTNKALRPIRKSKVSHIDDRFRLCTMCNKVKTQESFYMHSNGRTRQAVCKECTYPRARFNGFLRQKLYEEAAAVLETMPPHMQPPYRARLEEALAQQG